MVVVLCDNVSPLFADSSAHEFIPSNRALHVKCSFNVAVVDGVVGECRGGPGDGWWAVPVVVLFDPFLYSV